MNSEKKRLTRRSFVKAIATTTVAMSYASNEALRAIAQTSSDTSRDLVLQACATPTPFSRIVFTDGFWAPRIEINRTNTIPQVLHGIQSDGSYFNFAIVAGHSNREYSNNANNSGDVKVFKYLNAIAYSLRIHPDPVLEAHADKLIDQIVAAQDSDGYLCTSIQMTEPSAKLNPPTSHYQMYILGHFIEAGVEYYKTTGKANLLTGALRYLELVRVKIDESENAGYEFMPQHQAIEIALAKLYRLKGQRKHLNMLRWYIEKRGVVPGSVRTQSHVPLLDMREGVGHGVRSGYIWAAVADLASITEDARYAEAARIVWNDLVEKKMFLTGGIGGNHERIGEAYKLGSDSAYNETCSSIAMLLFSHRMAMLYCDGRYMDVVERLLYNAVLSGESLDGRRFFYSNPLKHDGKVKFCRPSRKGAGRTMERQPWYDVPCCPPNLARTMASVGDYMYAVREEYVYVNLYAGSTGKIAVLGEDIGITQETRYPWEGSVRITLTIPVARKFSLCLRIPGWARGEVVSGDLYRFLDMNGESASIWVNGRECRYAVEKGYACIRREWKEADVVELKLPMPIRYVVTNTKVEELSNKVALQRGPLVYAVEEVDNGSIKDLVLSKGQGLISEHLSDLLGGVTVIKGRAERKTGRGGKQQSFTAIPYYAWSNRGVGEMLVWMDRP